MLKPVAVHRRLLLSAGLLVALAGAPGEGAGTGGIEVTPVPAVVDGKPVTAFHVTLADDGTAVSYALRNISSQPRSARVYAASARPDGQGGFTIGDAGSSAYVVLPDHTVALSPKEERRETFRVKAPDDPPAETVHAAVVVEVQQGAVVQRAATMVYLEPGQPAAVPGWVRVVAVVALAAVSAGLAALRLRRRGGARSGRGRSTPRTT